MRSESGAVGNADTHSREEHGRHSQSDKKFKLRIVFKLREDEAETLYHAILPETLDVPSRRVSVSLSLETGMLALEIRAVDLIALRAALNSFLRFIDSTLQSIRLLSG